MLSTVGFWDSFYEQKSGQRAEDKEWYLPSTTAAATVRAFVGAWERGPLQFFKQQEGAARV